MRDVDVNRVLYLRLAIGDRVPLVNRCGCRGKTTLLTKDAHGRCHDAISL